MRKTRLMSKLYSETPDVELQNKVLAKIEEAHANGSSTLDEDGEKLQFADVDGDIIVEDQTDGMTEVTRISQNPDDENDLVMSAVDVPAEEPTPAPVEPEPAPAEPTPETKNESENLASVEISRIPGPDGETAEDIVDNLEIKVGEGIDDAEKSGTNQYSLKFKHYSKSKAEKVAKLFSACADCIDKVVESANVDEDVQVKFEGEQMKIMSIRIGKPVRTFSIPEEPAEPAADPKDEIKAIIEDANKLADLADEGITKENAEEVKTLAEEVIGKAEAIETEEFSMKSIKRMCSMFSEEAAKVMDADPEPEPAPAPAEPEPTPEPTPEPEPAPAQKEESEKAVSQCPETGKWFVEGDDTPYESEEEAKEAAKSFSDPTVTVTIENLEPASVSELLGGTKEEETPVEPVVDPNAGPTGRSFSMPASEKKYDNPLLFTEIN